MLCLMSACKGRTLDNVQPTGDTVEVPVNTIDADSTIAPAATDTINQ